MNLVDMAPRMNCPNLASALQSILGGYPEDALRLVDEEIKLRAHWTRPLRFDIASGQPVGHLPEDEKEFGELIAQEEMSSYTRSSIFGLWGSDVTSMGSETLNVTRSLLVKAINQ